MANFYGDKSKYLVWNKNISKYAAMTWLVFIAAIFIYLPLNPKVKYFTVPGFIACVLVFGPILWFLYKQFKKEEFSLYAFASGLKGESIVAEELKKLDKAYTVFWDIKLPDRKDNIDFVVLGPISNYLVEVKNHSGIIDFNGRELTCNGKPFKSNFIKIAKAQAWALSEYISTTTHKKTFINPIIVFSNSYAHTRLGAKPIDGVYVVQNGWLNKIISPYEFPDREPDKDILESIRNLSHK